MNEKTQLLDLFKQVANAADLFRENKREIMGSDMLSGKGKESEVRTEREQFVEAMDGYREKMLQIVNDREEDYTAFYVKIVQGRMVSGDYQSALAANIDMLKRGYMGKIEVMAMLKLYENDDLAISRIADIMHQMHSPFCDMLTDRITIKKQLNAFESIRRVIESKVNADLAEKHEPKPSPAVMAGMKQPKFSREQFYFGLGYYAIVNELNEDLTINSPDATLALQANTDKTNTMHRGSNVENKKAKNTVDNRKGAKQKDKPAQIK